MARLKMIYATILAVIYVTASLMSSVDVLTCDHPHHHHHHHAEHTECECHAHSCEHGIVALSAECCDHEHDLLSDTHTAFIVEKEGSDTADLQPITLDLTEALLASNISLDAIAQEDEYHYIGYESTPPCAAFTRFDALRAPPALA